mmetsp:Transcript_2635/g.7197  ORF Transcript_2635/g.7197 Transcript_2635/m.7197 type:complete len:156 (-) Transcript_2635:254-721(-)
MIGSVAWRALMRRNLLYRRRNIISTIFELCLPIAFVGILVGIKGAVEDLDGFSPEEVPANFPINNDALKIFSFTDYVTALQAKRTCTAGNAPPMTFPGGSGSGSGSSLQPSCRSFCLSKAVLAVANHKSNSLRPVVFRDTCSFAMTSEWWYRHEA